ncbi:MAG: spore cortex biosynthesis protein YabQ [Oscillospiraceae bacterium]|nr:spore cortex biosynthesis protein YabQ [Oscillospiraceae bacterium]
MGVVLSDQLAMFCRSVLLGGVLGLIYDLLRTVRPLGGRWWGAALDAFFCMLTAAALFLFVMAGDGELRLFYLAAALGGMVLYFCLLSRILRPVWDFWLLILLAPLRLGRHAAKKIRRRCKKAFFLGKKWITIRVVGWRGKLRRSRKKGAEGDGQNSGGGPEGETKADKKTKRTSDRSAPVSPAAGPVLPSGQSVSGASGRQSRRNRLRRPSRGASGDKPKAGRRHRKQR